LHAVAPWASAPSNFSLKTSLVLRIDSLLVGKSDSPCLKQDQTAMFLSSVFRRLWETFRGCRTRFRGRAKSVRHRAGTAFTISPEWRSESPRNRVRLHPGIAFGIARIPQRIEASFDCHHDALRLPGGLCRVSWAARSPQHEPIPRAPATQEQLREAIRGPLGRVRIARSLMDLLLNEIGDDPGRLPVLQHALMRTWNQWKQSEPEDSRPIRVEDYLRVGGIAHALDIMRPN